MVEIFALGIYSVQWLGVVLGVGAEVVLLCAHLIALHQHKPQWLGSVSAVRAAQFMGLLLIILSGLGAVAYQFLIGQPGLLLQAVFGFKWVLIVALTVAYVLEKHLVSGRAVLEGFAGATWLALFLVHSLAPVAAWLDLTVYYVAWLAVFSLGWGVSILVMKRTGSAAAAPALDIEPAPVVAKVAPKPAPAVVKVVPKPEPAPVIAPVIKPVVAAPAPVIKPVVHVAPPPPPPPPPKPIVKPAVAPAPAVVAAPAPVHVQAAPVVATVTPAVHKESFWHKLMAMFASKPKAAESAAVVAAATPAAQPVKPIEHVAPPVIKVVTPVPPPPPPQPAAPKPVAAPVTAAVVKAPEPAALPVVEHLELEAPHVVVPPKPVQAEQYKPDYNHIPGLRIMPQRMEDLHLHNRAPIVQPA